MKEKCIIYIRVSTDRQDTDRQIIDLQQYAERNNFSIDATFEDKLSGYDDDREGLQAMQNYALQHNIKTVLVWEVSRLARKQSTLNKVLEFFQTHNVNAFFLQQNVWLLENGKISFAAGLILNVMGFLSNYEVQLMKARQKSGRDKTKIEGKFLGGSVLFGYDLDENNKFIPHRITSKIVKEIFQQYADGVTSMNIVRWLKKEHLNEIPKGLTYVTNIPKLIKNQAYNGEFPYPKIVDDEFFQKANEQRIRNISNDKSTKCVSVMGKLMICPYCGYHLTLSHKKYVCKNISDYSRTTYRKKCESSVTHVYIVDQIVWKIAKQYYAAHLMENDTNEQATKINSRLTQIDTEINLKKEQNDDLNKQRKRLVSSFASGVFSEEDVAPIVANNDRERALIDSSIKLLLSEKSALESKLEALSNIGLKQKEWLLKIYKITDPAEKKEAIKTVVENVHWIRFGKMKVLQIKFLSGKSVFAFYRIKSKFWYRIVGSDNCTLDLTSFVDAEGNDLIDDITTMPHNDRELKRLKLPQIDVLEVNDNVSATLNYFDLD